MIVLDLVMPLLVVSMLVVAGFGNLSAWCVSLCWCGICSRSVGCRVVRGVLLVGLRCCGWLC